MNETYKKLNETFFFFKIPDETSFIKLTTSDRKYSYSLQPTEGICDLFDIEKPAPKTLQLEETLICDEIIAQDMMEVEYLEWDFFLWNFCIKE